MAIVQTFLDYWKARTSTGTTMQTGDELLVRRGDSVLRVTGAPVPAGSVARAQLENSAALSVIGRSANSSGVPADIAAGTDHHVLRRSGTSLGFGLLVDANIDAAAAIAGTKIANTPAGNIAATTAQAAINEIDASKVEIVATRTALKALDVTKSAFATLTEAGRQGEWVLKTGSPPVTDTQEGIYVVSDTASYYWERIYTGKPDPYWFGALGGTNDDTVAVQACLDVTGSCCLRYRDDGYTFGGIIMDGQQSIESQGKVTVNCTAQVGGYMFLIRAFGVGKHVRIENLFLDGADADTASTAIRFDTGSGVVFGFRCKNVDFSNWGEAIGDIASVSNYIVDVIFEDCICFYTRGRQVYSGRSRGFITFRDFRIDHTYNTAQVTWEGARFEDVIGLELEKFDVVGPTIPTSTYQSGAIGLAIIGAAGSSSVWLRRLLIDNTRGPALSITDVSNVFGVDVCLFQNLGPPLQLVSVAKSLFTNTKIVGGIGLTGAVASSNGVSMSSCSKVVFSGLEVEANTGSGVVMVSCEDCCVIGGYSNENTGWGFLEATAGTRNLRSGVRSIGNGTGSLVQVGAECATVDWWPNSGLFTASTVGAATI